MQLSKLMTQNNNRQGVEDLLAKLQKECSHLEGEASSLQQDLADSQTSCEQLQGALAESRWAAGLQGCRVAGLQGCRVAGLQGCRVAGLQGCRVAGLQGCMQVKCWAQRCLSSLHLHAAGPGGQPGHLQAAAGGCWKTACELQECMNTACKAPSGELGVELPAICALACGHLQTAAGGSTSRQHWAAGLHDERLASSKRNAEGLPVSLALECS